MTKVNILSLNVGGIQKSPNLNTSAIPFDTPDIYVEFTQEDYRPLNTLSLVNIPNYKQLGVYALNRHKKSQNIITNVYVKNDSKISVITSGVIPIKSKEKGFKSILIHGAQKIGALIPGQSIGYSKGGVYVKLRIENKELLLLNLHLPVNTKKENMGYAYRRSQLINILNQIIPYMSDPDTILLVGGDLNFRMNRDGVNQLTNLLKSNDIMLKELEMPTKNSKTFTCKFRENSSKNCRLTKIPDEGSEDFKKLSENTQQRCGDSKRIPSRCDRFLVYSPYKIDVSTYKSLVLLDSSDHNAIYTSFKIHDYKNTRPEKRRLIGTQIVNREYANNNNNNNNNNRKNTYTLKNKNNKNKLKID